jgi:hypothetical protein
MALSLVFFSLSGQVLLYNTVAFSVRVWNYSCAIILVFIVAWPVEYTMYYWAEFKNEYGNCANE